MKLKDILTGAMILTEGNMVGILLDIVEGENPLAVRLIGMLINGKIAYFQSSLN